MARKRRKGTTKTELAERVKDLSKKIDKQENKKKPGRPNYREEFKRLCGISYDKRAALIDEMYEKAMELFVAGETSLEEVSDYIRKGVWPLLYQTYADALSGNQTARQFLINKVVANASVKVEGEAKTPVVEVNLGEESSN